MLTHRSYRANSNSHSRCTMRDSLRYILRSARFVPVVAGLMVLVSGCRDSISDKASFSGDDAYAWVTRQCEIGYRFPGTEAHRQTGDLIISTLEQLDWEVSTQEFPYMGIAVRNILAWKGSGPAVLLGAHYDTRPQADMEDPTKAVMGANDGASGVAVLLELARVLDVEASGHQAYLAFFDAEDSGNLNGWDWIAGSTYMASAWGKSGEAPLQAMVLVDMIGDADLQIYYEHNSDAALRAEIWAVAEALGYKEQFIKEVRHSLIDDHIPFARLGIPAIDIIDFDYPYWHTTQDTPDKVSADSLAAVGRTLEDWLEP